MTASPPSKRTCILITGMHRCATSAIAGTMGFLGVEQARNLVPAHESNAKGHFEAEAIVALNDAAFEAEGLTGFHCQNPVQDDEAALDSQVNAILEAVDAEYGDAPVIVLKDPRIARLDVLWRRVAERSGWDVRYVVMYRQAADVAGSLWRRNKWPAIRSVWLWLAYLSGAERVSAGYPRAFVDADRFVTEPVETLERLGHTLGLTWPKSIADSETAAEIEAFIDGKLFSREARIELPWPELVESAETALKALEEDPETPEAVSALQDIGDVVQGSGGVVDTSCMAAESYFQSYRKAVVENVRVQDASTPEAEIEDILNRLENENRKLKGRIHQSERDARTGREELVTVANRRERRLLDIALWTANEAEKAERHPVRKSLRRFLYGLIVIAANMPVVKNTFIGRKASRLLVAHTPRRFVRHVEETYERDPLPLPPPAPASDRSHYVELTREGPPENTAATVIAFYLPQYHPIAENDRWWGTGFTEWTNVTKAVPQFRGHYQPHRPGELGYYDLRLPAVQERQAELAQQYGIGAFCYYFYWFAGKTLLEEPLEAMLGNPRIDMPFCLCWANENWTRTWDGREKNILIAQEHSAEDDLAFIEYIAKYLRDPRYLRIDGAPVLVVYRPNLLPDMKATAERWRNWCQSNGIGRIHLCMTQSFESTDPETYGLDASIEFPPNNSASVDVTHTVIPYSRAYGGTVYDWTVFPKRAETYKTPGFLTYRAVCTSWDNTARRGENGAVFKGATPRGFRDWLRLALVDTIKRFDQPSERLVFIKAWNEWAEGAHLEPDEEYGYAWLDAVRNAHELAQSAEYEAQLSAPLALVVHDAHRHGAQMLALALAKTIRACFKCDLHIVVLGDGVMMEEFEAVAPVYRPDPSLPPGEAASALAERLAKVGVRHAIVNSVASGSVVESFKEAGFRLTVLVHEMPALIASYGLEDSVRSIAKCADRIVFPAAIVRDGFETIAAISAGRSVIRPQGIYTGRAPRDEAQRAKRRAEKRADLGVADDAYVVVGAGFADHRKGIDLFVDTAMKVCSDDTSAVFIWAGRVHPDYADKLPERVDAAGLCDRILFPGHVDDIANVMLASDVFLLTSREDPFPSVVIEAMDCGLPVVAIAGTGGCADLVAQGYGELAPEADVAHLVEQVDALRTPEARSNFTRRGRNLVERDFSFRRYAYDLVAQDDAPRVSVVVPSYNYLTHIEDRLRSIAAQTWPIYELIVLDDASTDGTAEWLSDNIDAIFPGATLELSSQNSGSVFQQWKRGLEMARGDLVWVAEADDDCDPDMLSRLVAVMLDDPEIRIAYCQSRAIGTGGELLMRDYTEYTADIDPVRWRSSFVEDCRSALARSFAVKNVIPNVSATLFRRDALKDALVEVGDELSEWRVAGDWRIYAALLSRGGRIAYEAEPLNAHRRHTKSVTTQLNSAKHLAEIEAMQKIVASTVTVDEETAGRARRYRDAVLKKFEAR